MASVATKKIKSLAQGGPSKLTTILAHLNAKPRLSLPGVKSLKLTYAFRNDHFGARHFAKEDLPRIRWANPELDIVVERPHKTLSEQWAPTMKVDFQNGQSRTLSLDSKLSSSILTELMDIAGGKPWADHKASSSSSSAASSSPSEGSSSSNSSIPTKLREPTRNLPSFETFKATHPDAGKPKVITTVAPKKKSAQEVAEEAAAAATAAAAANAATATPESADAAAPAS